jgi:hypothetical protein
MRDLCVDGPDERSPAGKGALKMNHPVAVDGAITRQQSAWSPTARRVLRQLFEVDPAAIDESRTLADFEGCELRDIAGPLTPMAWRIRLKDRIFSCFGVNFDIDEPLSTLVARIELAERGVRYAY